MNVSALGSRLSLSWRVIALAVAVTAASCAVVGVAAYCITDRLLVSRIDSQLHTRADTLSAAYMATAGTLPPVFLGQVGDESGVAILTADGGSLRAGAVPIGSAEQRVGTNGGGSTLRTVHGFRVLAVPVAGGDAQTTVVITQSLNQTRKTLHTLTQVLVLAGLGLMIFAGLAGRLVAAAGLRPVRRLDQATRRIAATEELTPIPVTGTDELANLTRTFNTMLASLEQSRATQTRLINTAATDLAAPLAVLRNNVEQLIARRTSPTQTEQLRATVITQIEQLSQTITQLVDAGRATTSTPTS